MQAGRLKKALAGLVLATAMAAPAAAVVTALPAHALANNGAAEATMENLKLLGYTCDLVGINSYKCTLDGSTTYYCPSEGTCTAVRIYTPPKWVVRAPVSFSVAR